MNVKKTLLVSVLILAFGAYVIFLKESNSSNSKKEDTPIAMEDNSKPKNMDNGKNSITQLAKDSTNILNMQSADSTYKDGIFTGDVVDAYYGDIQVSATISNGKLSDIGFLKYPQGNNETNEKSSHSLPILKSEAIASQSAKVDIVSGATQTAQGFMISLNSALNKAKL